MNYFKLIRNFLIYFSFVLFAVKIESLFFFTKMILKYLFSLLLITDGFSEGKLLCSIFFLIKMLYQSYNKPVIGLHTLYYPTLIKYINFFQCFSFNLNSKSRKLQWPPMLHPRRVHQQSGLRHSSFCRWVPMPRKLPGKYQLYLVQFLSWFKFLSNLLKLQKHWWNIMPKLHQWTKRMWKPSSYLFCSR